MSYAKTRKIILWAVFAVFALYAITLIFPFLWILLNSFKTNPDFFSNIWGLPSKWMFGNYLDVFYLKVGTTGLLSMFFNSSVIVIVGTLLSVFVSACAAYVISKYKFKGSGAIYMVAITIMLIPTTGSLSAAYKLMKDTGLYNTFIGVFLMYSGGFGFSFLLLYGFFKNISWAYAEAGQIDGCSDFRIFWQIMLPQAAPALTAVGIIQAINLWNDYFTPYMFLRKYPTVAVGLQMLTDRMTYDANWPVLFSLMIISILPVLALFIIFQKTIMENTVAGGLKG